MSRYLIESPLGVMTLLMVTWGQVFFRSVKVTCADLSSLILIPHLWNHFSIEPRPRWRVEEGFIGSGMLIALCHQQRMRSVPTNAWVWHYEQYSYTEKKTQLRSLNLFIIKTPDSWKDHDRGVREFASRDSCICVWNYYTIIEDENVEYNICAKTIKSNECMTNMMKHLKVHNSR